MCNQSPHVLAALPGLEHAAEKAWHTATQEGAEQFTEYHGAATMGHCKSASAQQQNHQHVAVSAAARQQMATIELTETH